MNPSNKENIWSANKLTIKGIIVGVLILAMLIPTLFIMNLIEERGKRQEEITHEVNSKWASAQTFTGPVLIIPYNEMLKPENGESRVVKKNAYFLPEHLKINGVLQPEIRRRSIYNIAVYRTEMNIEGDFTALPLQDLGIAEADLLVHEARICIGVSDFRGIEDQLNIKWDDSSSVFNAGLPENTMLANGLSTPIDLTIEGTKTTHNFKLQVKVRGSERLSLTPVGKSTTVHLTSTWSNPKFDGNFLPVTSDSVTEDGFVADWKVQHLNRNYPQSWKDTKYDINESRFGVTLLQPVDSYSKTTRSVKYAILFIALTFALYFFVEIMQKKMVHPIQYVLVGIALSIFYTLLLSISEFLRFNLAYAIAASATILLITLYTKSIFQSWKTASLFGSLLVMLYGFIFILIQLQDNALLFGSIGLFILLAIIMYYSRKIDWYGKAMNPALTYPGIHS